MKSCKLIKEQPNMFQGFTIVKPLSFWPFWALENSKPTSIYLVARTWILYILLNLQSRAVLGVGKSGGFLAVLRLLWAVHKPRADVSTGRLLADTCWWPMRLQHGGQILATAGWSGDSKAGLNIKVLLPRHVFLLTTADTRLPLLVLTQLFMRPPCDSAKKELVWVKYNPFHHVWLILVWFTFLKPPVHSTASCTVWG